MKFKLINTMETTIFTHTLFTGNSVLHDQVITCANGLITTIEKGNKQDAHYYTENLSPGLIDIHINGGKYLHFTKSPDVETIQDIATAFESVGTAYTLPTIVSCSLENMMKGISAIKIHRTNHPHSGVLGVHLEGPFLNHVKRGAHLPEYLQKPSDEILQQLLDHGKGLIKMITLAPELFTPKQLNFLMESGITISAGHSNATYYEAQKAFQSGISLVTHLFNAMSGFHHRDPGLVGACFMNKQVYAPIILDGFHCDYNAAKLASQIKKEKLFLISDALFIGKHVKEFIWENFNVRLEGERYINSENNLAGSTISLADGIRNAVRYLGVSLQEAIEMATIRPAKALGMENEIGTLAPGYPAVFTLFNNDLQNFSALRM